MSGGVLQIHIVALYSCMVVIYIQIVIKGAHSAALVMSEGLFHSSFFHSALCIVLDAALNKCNVWLSVLLRPQISPIE